VYLRQYLKLGSQFLLSIKTVVIPAVTCEMKDGLEANAEMSHFEWITVLDALRQHSNSLPVFVVEQRIVVRIQRRTLQLHINCVYNKHTNFWR